MKDQQETLYGVPAAELVRLAGVNRTTAVRWKRGKTRCPPGVLALMRLRIDGEASALLGEDWQGFRFGRDGRLYIPGWRNGIAPGALRALIVNVQETRALRAEARQLSNAYEAQQREIERLEKRCAFYRHQLILESRMGLALARIMG